MITVFNRRELYVTYDMQKQAQIREILAANGIDYLVKTVNHGASWLMGGSSRGHYGSFGIDQSLTYEYIIYVHKNDLEQAAYLIRKG